MAKPIFDVNGPIICADCGCASEWRAAFTTVGETSMARTLCPECAIREAAKKERRVALFVVVAAAACGYAIARGATSAVFLPVLAGLIFVASLPPLVVLHELGHVFAAKLVGAPVYSIVIGREPWWFDRDVIGVRVRVGGLMFGGAVYHEAVEGTRARLRSALITAGGPFANLVVAGIAFAGSAALSGPMEQSLARFALLIVGVSSALFGVTNLWPGEVHFSSHKIPNDGARILALLSGHADDTRKARGGGHYMRAQLAFGERRFETARVEVMRALELLDEALPRDACTILMTAIDCETGDARRVVEALRPLHGDASRDPAVSVGIANNLAWALLLIDEPGSHDEGLAAVDVARRIAPWERACLSTQACLMAASATTGNGRATEALQLIDKFRSPPRNASEAAALCVARGLVAAFEGEVSVARAEYARARALVVDSPILRLLERRLASP